MKYLSQDKKRLLSRYGEWAIVTGASSGIGRELAERIAEAQLHLVLVARRGDVLDAFAKELRAKYGIQTRTVVADMETAEGIAAVITATQHLSVGLLVASAGYGTSGGFLAGDIQAEVKMLRVNCEALLVLTHHFGRVFAQQGRGGIILLSSMVAFQGVPFAANYAATKAYVQSLAEALYVELKPMGVDVLAAAPGPVATGFGQRADMRMNGALTPQQIGVPILRALGRNSTVLPGFLTKFLVASLRMLPRWGKVHAMKLVMSGMTQHQSAT